MSYFTNFGHHGMMPGQVELGTIEVVSLGSITWGRLEYQFFFPGIIDGDSEDAGNVGHTDTLRPGLIMAKQRGVAGKWVPYDPTGTDGSEVPAAILLVAQRTTLNGDGVDRIRGDLLIRGFVRAGGLCIANSSTQGIVGKDEEFIIRKALAGQFVFDDDINGYLPGANSNQVALDSGTTLTLTNAQAGSHFMVSGATNKVITLPAVIVDGVEFTFSTIGGAGTLTIQGVGATDLVVLNNAGAKSVALATANEIVGATLKFVGYDGKWLVTPYVWDTQTVTIV